MTARIPPLHSIIECKLGKHHRSGGRVDNLEFMLFAVLTLTNLSRVITLSVDQKKLKRFYCRLQMGSNGGGTHSSVHKAFFCHINSSRIQDNSFLHEKLCVLPEQDFVVHLDCLQCQKVPGEHVRLLHNFDGFLVVVSQPVYSVREIVKVIVHGDIMAPRCQQRFKVHPTWSLLLEYCRWTEKQQRKLVGPKAIALCGNRVAEIVLHWCVSKIAKSQENRKADFGDCAVFQTNLIFRALRLCVEGMRATRTRNTNVHQIGISPSSEEQSPPSDFVTVPAEREYVKTQCMSVMDEIAVSPLCQLVRLVEHAEPFLASKYTFLLFILPRRRILYRLATEKKTSVKSDALTILPLPQNCAKR